jgi:hypothetical protein
MRIAHLIVASGLAISTVLAGPALARNADARKAEDKSTNSSTCSAYQQAADGSWEQLPCKETGERGQTQTQHKPATQGADQGGR